MTYVSTGPEQRYLSDLYRILVENVVDFSIFLVDVDGRVMSWNPGSSRMFGYSSEEIIGQDVAVLFVEEDRVRQEPTKERARALVEGRSEDERWHLHKDGTRLYVSGIMVALREGDRLVAFAKVGRDRTAERRLQDELQRANAAKDEFLAVVSHELRTPLTSTLGWAQLARYTSLDEETLNTALEAIERTARLQSQLVDDLLDVSRVAAGKLWMDSKPVDLTEMLRAAVDGVRPMAQQKELFIEATAPEEKVFVLGDPNRLQQVFWNLLSNAVKFTPTQGRIHAQLSADGGSAVLTVTDSGQGISAEFLPYIFDRFRQGTSVATRTFGGLGLGLALVRHIVERLGGRVHARSAGEGHGAEFRVELPLLSAESLGLSEVADLGRTHPKAPPGVKEFPPISNVRLLLVEDEPDTRRMLETLMAQSGAWYRSASNGTDAIQLFVDEQPEIVVTDIAMPIMSGFELLARLRSIEEQRGWIATPVIALTALTAPDERARLLAAGFQLYVGKPVDAAELTAAIASVVARE